MGIVAKGRFKIAEGMFDENMRVAEVIHIPTMVACCADSLPSDVRDFLDNDLAEHLRTLRQGAPSFVEHYKRVRTEETRFVDVDELADYLGRQRECEFVVRVEWASREYRHRGSRPLLGGYAVRWSYHRLAWFAGTTIADCVRQARDVANQEHRKAWDMAPPESKAAR